MVRTDPRSGGNHGDHSNDDTENTPGEDGRRSVLDMAVLEGADDGVDEPGNAGGGAAGVDASEMLQETGQEDTKRKRGPLRSKCMSWL